MKAKCPSYECREGAELIGLVSVDGLVEFIEPRLIDPQFVQISHSCEKPPEDRFRFSGKCAEGACSQWQNGRCGLADDIVKLEFEVERLPACPIRNSCRWFSQVGKPACRRCVVMKRGAQTG